MRAARAPVDDQGMTHTFRLNPRAFWRHTGHRSDRRGRGRPGASARGASLFCVPFFCFFFRVLMWSTGRQSGSPFIFSSFFFVCRPFCANGQHFSCFFILVMNRLGVWTSSHGETKKWSRPSARAQDQPTAGRGEKKGRWCKR
ncbi:hypothetical protein TW95_gp1154 [Pandoravirus inopinatum]|uniref:Uncharacterized protein n=1 Tax=Pandoravirus inopinatum TaxID=1605721 RepID=A0A0B5IYE6_9VIRU|nr:hypothetical protein TW95_gp1154 [Pandoravirus inopinatum]AJF97888.1 hypothetical protein [Pandoravirus inopinatum]